MNTSNMNTSNRKHNFSAGPCTLPLEVLEEAQAEFLDYQGAGMSIIEMSHRGRHFQEIADSAKALSMEIFQVPDDFTVLLLQGGAMLQFSMVPINLLPNGKKGAYVRSGAWANGAYEAACQYTKEFSAGQHSGTYAAWDGTPERFMRMPQSHEINIEERTRYLHITTNETIGGIRFYEWPDVEVPMVADMSSEYMARPLPWEKFDLVYGGAQKNLGPAGLTVVFVRTSILPENHEFVGHSISQYLRYLTHAEHGSMLNTPPVFAIYMYEKVLKWMKRQGGLSAMESNAAEKSSILYKLIDQSSKYYRSPVEFESRSHMNVVFRLRNDKLEEKFLQQAAESGFMNLKGHRSVGGCRASIYNALPKSSVQALAEFMSAFMDANPD